MVAPETRGITPHTVSRLLKLEIRRINMNFKKHIKFIIQEADNGKQIRSNAPGQQKSSRSLMCESE